MQETGAMGLGWWAKSCSESYERDRQQSKPGAADRTTLQNYLQDWLKRREFYIPRAETWAAEKYHLKWSRQTVGHFFF